MAETYAELSKTSTEELKRQYDLKAASTNVGLSFYREEIARREAAEQNIQMMEFTKQVRDMTLAITAMTAIVMALTIYLVFK